MDDGDDDVSSGRASSLSELAEKEARAAHSDRQETQHALLAMLGAFTSDAGRALSSHGVTREKVQAAVSRVIEAGVSEKRHFLNSKRLESCELTGGVPPSREAEEAWVASLEEAQLLGHRNVTWAHSLLGLLRIKEGIAAKALVEVGIDTSALRDSVIKMVQLPSE